MHRSVSAIALRALFALLPLAPLVAVAAPFGYATGFATLYRIDLATGQATAVGPIGFNDVEGLAFSPQGALYGVADATRGSGGPGTDFLIRIDPTTGAGTLVGQLTALAGRGPAGNLDYGLAFDCSGALWTSSDTTGELWPLDPNTAAVGTVRALGLPVSGLAADSRSLVGLTSEASPRLIRIDAEAGTTAIIGSLAVGGVVADAGLDFAADGTLFGTLDPEPESEGRSRLVRIDASTGRGTAVGEINVDTGIEGLAIAPTAACAGTGGGSGGSGAPLDVARVVPTLPAAGLGLLAALLLVPAFTVLRANRPAR